MKLIISGGGTGGHIFPAVAIANEVRRRHPDAEILFVGANGRMEMTRVPEAGYEIVGLDITGLQRSLSPQNLLFPIRLMRAVRKAGKLIDMFKPDAVVGVGGYASAPVLLAATSRGIPALIQEQNSYAGLVNKLLARRVQRICVAYEGMEEFFPADRLVLTGNPVRTEIADGQRAEALPFFGLDPARPVLLVIGGSLGARTLNQATAAALPRLQEAGVQLLWQTGKAYYPQAQEQAAPFAARNLQALEFVRRMDLAYAAADVVVSRAGALSVSELCLTGKPSILVPSPNVAEDHQTKNALALTRQDAALLVRDADAAATLYDQALALLQDPARQRQLAANIRALARPRATATIVDELEKLLPATVRS
ncbi:UDP-N-acetylglucosamine--N-acetylmuramyl-(pentapeptide) pyrophosphoryl-undecaprenol N-acetylglucosamine transferase [Hymenobacter luteus]|uniref:UDP-N-acetylglucosamine--N-acetylmuramyl-(pentapeptide) pyrophosphoryl-undecaprenol N-acetylglucosamine transferase n=2 Tax=Hymenobacter TaxID=89966 RepID=A0A7W9T0H8_9BACT|nr:MULTISPECIES: undecaprenyldiphospho-muramoylpentapeptide beta-N-acetylglucosaminyltransferase [Hymenobacter]MBB4600965.1 UDP-N-acetylglucosamine--N-acetylmuramyl-(pentapeptide) pyrophosphoryl-undecaprenol N-acetylglucosamine transferase [Hymenobacter latericoloratus]MBB6058828.1 UDP-N-acetylglucosamine--N-acetylmuramyl-(pentapeptide) pyrophosphoryl-undecaprenol N-acetylglucosamine transferase [Hymenobacter luteus]